MNEVYLKSTKRLSEVLPSNVYWLSNAQLCEFLGISESTRKRDHSVLKALGLFPVGWTNRTGYDRGDKERGQPDKIEIFWEFRQLHFRTDRNCAIENIVKLMRIIEHERQRQGTSTGSNRTAATAIRTA